MLSRLVCCCLPLCMLITLPLDAATLEDGLQAMQATNTEAGAAQQNIGKLQAETQAMVVEYQRLTRTVDHQADDAGAMQARVLAQQQELASLREQLAGRQITQQRLEPLLRSMVDALEQFVALDLPFHQEERLARAIKLKQLLNSSALPLPDKYRSVLEAYQQELELGRSMEAWRGELALAEEKLTVEFLRIGRVAFYFQTMDGLRSGYWDRSGKQWREMPAASGEDIRHGLRIARNQQAPQLLALPLARTDVRAQP